jgi:uncharacterized protein YbbC (DUF1343 family)
VVFEAAAFTPRRPGDGKYADTLLAGIRLRVTDRGAYDPPAAAVHLLAAVLAVHHGEFEWIARHFDRLAGGPVLREALAAGEDPGAIVASWRGALAAFAIRRRAALLYPDAP